MSRHAKKNEQKFSVRKWLRLACLAVFLVGLCGLILYWVQQNRAQDSYSELQQQNQPASSAVASSTASSAASSQPVVLAPPEVDFDALWAKNADAYAWIYIPGTLVDYPMMQNAKETDYYLDHTFERTYGLPGAIYTRNDTAKDFSDPCTVVYGHNMKNDTMFGSLHNYWEAEFFNNMDYRVIYTISPDGVRQWTVFAAVEYSDVLLSAAFDFNDPASMKAFLNSLSSSYGRYDYDIPVDGNSRIMVLSTCVSGNRDTVRYLVVAVLTGEENA